MKREVTDIRDLRAELSTEDQELMRFFPQNRRYALDDMLLVRRGGETYLLRKEDVARMNKFIYSLLCAAFTVFGGLSLVMAIHCFVTGSGKPGVWLAAFELTIMLTMIRHFGKARGRYEK